MAAGTSYRPDIDGLRAVAIIPVVLFHAGVAQFSGGFIGVDVFFVISGYLITQLLEEDRSHGRFSILTFYDRRIRRILPALLTMLAVIMVPAFFTMLPDEMRAFGAMTAASAWFVGNLFLWRSGQGYFDDSAAHLPNLHLWSLAVEEQFYVIWPLLLAMAAIPLLRRWRLPIILSLFVLSLGLSITAVATDHPVPAFYLFPTRAWELAAGALLALVLGEAVAPRWLAEALSALGLALILACIFLYQQSTPFPGLNAIWPCLGAVMVLRFASGTWTGHLLSLPPMIWTGLISYSLYLWHWPFLIFAAFYFNHALTPLESGMVILASVAVSAASWRFVEQPFRGHRGWKPWRSIAWALAAMTVVAGAGAGLVAAGGLPGRLPLQASAALAGIEPLEPIQVACTEDRAATPATAVECTVPSRTGSKMVLWGDSHARHYAPTMQQVARASGFGLFYMGEYGCPPLLEAAPAHLPAGGNAAPCWEFNRAAFERIRQDRSIRTVILAGRWSLYTEPPPPAGFVDSSPEKFNNYLGAGGIVSETAQQARTVFAMALERTVTALEGLGLKVVVVEEIPQFPGNVPRCVARENLQRRTGDNCLSINAAANQAQFAQPDAIIAAVARRHPQMRIFRPERFFCDATTCTARPAGEIFYRDHNHLNLAGSAYLARMAAAEISGYQ